MPRPRRRHRRDVQGQLLSLAQIPDELEDEGIGNELAGRSCEKGGFQAILPHILDENIRELKMNDAVIDAVPEKLFQEARRRLLKNEPLRADSGEGGSGAQDLSLGEVAALKAVGLNTDTWAEGAERDPLKQSIADYMALLETSYTTSEAAKYLGVDASRIRQRLREHSLFGIDYDGERRLPRFQFERKQVIPGLREVIGALPKELNPLDVAEWFLSPNPDLEAGDRVLSPREWLLKGESTEVVVGLAQSFE